MPMMHKHMHEHAPTKKEEGINSFPRNPVITDQQIAAHCASGEQHNPDRGLKETTNAAKLYPVHLTHLFNNKSTPEHAHLAGKFVLTEFQSTRGHHGLFCGHGFKHGCVPAWAAE